MFEIEIRNTDSEKNLGNERLNMFKKVIESLSDIVDQMEIKCTSSGLSIQVMDSMHVGMADIFFSNDFFKNYRCDRDVQLGIPLKNFVMILRGIALEDKSVLKFSCEDSPQILKIQHTLPNSHYESDITLYQIGSETYNIPAMEYTSVIKMPSDQFRSISKLIGSFGDFISFDCAKDSISFNQTADMLRNHMTLKADNDQVFIDSSEPINVEISMKYLNLVNKVSSLSPTICLNLGDCSPVFFDINFFGLGYFKFYVAPKAKE